VQHVGVLATKRHQTWHLVLGQPDLLAAELGQRQIRNLEVDAVADIRFSSSCRAPIIS